MNYCRDCFHRSCWICKAPSFTPKHDRVTGEINLRACSDIRAEQPNDTCPEFKREPKPKKSDKKTSTHRFLHK